MKKILLSLFMAIFALATAQAQIVKNLEYPNGHFGFRVAFSSSNYSYSDYSPLPFVSGGFAADFKICPLPIYLETGAYYANRGYKYDYYEGKEADDNHSVLVPFLASYHLYFTDNLSIQPFYGAFVSYGFDYEEVDYGLRIGCGFNFGRLYANIGYDLGLKNYEEYDRYGDYIDMKSRMFFLTIGINLAGSY